MVKVLASINAATENVSNSLKRLVAYQRQIKTLVKELRDTQVSAEKAKEYLKEYMTLLYKMQLKIYDQNGENIDDVRLFVNSDNFNETFI
jgi:flagellin-like hook-associated protein FlgL